jgi:hypothetical protein
MAKKLRIPEEYAPGLAEFLKLSSGDLAALLAALRDAKPTLKRADLARSIEQVLSWGGSKVWTIVRLLSSLYAAREQADRAEEEEVSDFVTELIAAAERSGKKELSPADWEPYYEALIEILSKDTALAVATKATSVMTDHARVFCHCRVLTDLRPIFESDVGKGPAAIVGIHTLKVVYHEENEHREFFVAMDRDDVKELAAHLDRALKKEETLKALCADTPLLFLEVSS